MSVTTQPVSFRVTASHANPEFDTIKDVTMVARPSAQGPGKADKFYCSHPKLGCGKDYATPRDAIRELLLDHAYSAIVLTQEG